MSCPGSQSPVIPFSVMTKNSQDPIKLDKAQADAAVGTLGRAFYEYNLVRYFFPEDEPRRNFVRYFCSIPLYYGFKYGEVYATSSEMEGVAVWYPSKNHPFSTVKVLRSTPFSVVMGFGRSGASKMRHVDAFLNEIHGRLVPEKHWFLQMIGVDPSFQGKGYASRLLKPMLSRADEEKLPCYLETNTEHNVELYEHFGFEVLEDALIPGTDVMNWAMLRKNTL